ncbi:unnamed protein product, partial [Prorocentrum cordatum]
AEGNDLRYIGGGTATNKTNLVAPTPLSAAPSAQLAPPNLVSGDARFLEQHKGARPICDGRKQGPFELREGTWEDDHARSYLAQNQELAYNSGFNCRWLCLRRWQRRVEDKGAEVPHRRHAIDKLAAHHEDHCAAQGIRVRNALPVPLRMPAGHVQVPKPSSACALTQLLLLATDTDDPAQTGSTVPNCRPIDDRFGTGATESGLCSAICDSGSGEPVELARGP